MIRVCIECDKCGNRTSTEKNHMHAIHFLRNGAAKVGWTNKPHSSKDYCPRCSRDMAKAAAS